jgi:heme A synthase
MNARKSFHLCASLASFLTLCLITLGGFVKNTGSSLACPDWPLCFGQVFPKMEGGVAIEHSHRLLAAFIGLLVIAIVYFSNSFKRENPKLFKVSIIALLVVILQGVLGGLTVLLQISPLVSTFHLALSQIFLLILIYLSLKSRPQGFPEIESAQSPAPKVSKLLLISGVLLYFQILWGAAVRHTGAGAACGLGHKYSLLCMEASTGGLTLWPDQIQSQFHILHRYIGLIMIFVIVWGTLPALKWAKANGIPLLRKLVIGSHILVLMQVLLGLYTVMSGIGTLATTLHLLFAALLFADLIALNILVRHPKSSA